MQSTGFRIVCAALLAALVGASCSSSGSSKAGSTTTTTSTTVATADGSAAAALAARFPTTVPSGYLRQDDTPGGGGPADLKQAAAFDASPNAEVALGAYKFVRGHERFWLSPDHKGENVLVAFQFETPSGAQQYQAYSNRELITPLDGPKGKPFAVKTIPNAFGVTVSTTTVQLAAVVFAKGGYVVQAVATGSSPAARQEQAIALARLMYDTFK